MIDENPVAEIRLAGVADARAIRSKTKSIAVCGVAAPRSGDIYTASPFFNAFEALGGGKIYSSEELLAAKIKIDKNPKHGALEMKTQNAGYNYVPDAGFQGADAFDISVQSRGKKIRIHYIVKVFVGGSDWGYEHDCKKAPFTNVYEQTQAPAEDVGRITATWQKSAQLSSILAATAQPLTYSGDVHGAAFK